MTLFPPPVSRRLLIACAALLAVALIERANPMPPVPEGEQAATLEFIIPVDFNIR